MGGNADSDAGGETPPKSTTAAPSPCRSCGACCATYRVTMPRSELDSAPGGRVPTRLTEAYTATTACMREHPDVPGRCIALAGSIGTAVNCAIYAQRPDACSEFAPLALLGLEDESCTAARRRHGLPPLGGI
jgi:Fe-S-cluster containining protein